MKRVSLSIYRKSNNCSRLLHGLGYSPTEVCPFSVRSVFVSCPLKLFFFTKNLVLKLVVSAFCVYGHQEKLDSSENFYSKNSGLIYALSMSC